MATHTWLLPVAIVPSASLVRHAVRGITVSKRRNVAVATPGRLNEWNASAMASIAMCGECSRQRKKEEVMFADLSGSVLQVVLVVEHKGTLNFLGQEKQGSTTFCWSETDGRSAVFQVAPD